MKSDRRLVFEWAVTLSLWAAFLYCLLPLAQVIAPGLSERLAKGAFSLGPFHASLSDLPGFGLFASRPSTLVPILLDLGKIVLAVASLYLLWVSYNCIPWGGLRASEGAVPRLYPEASFFLVGAACAVFWVLIAGEIAHSTADANEAWQTYPAPARILEEKTIIASVRPAAISTTDGRMWPARVERSGLQAYAGFSWPYSGSAAAADPQGATLFKMACAGPVAATPAADPGGPKESVANVQTSAAATPLHRAPYKTVKGRARGALAAKAWAESVKTRKALMLRMALPKWELLLSARPAPSAGANGAAD